MLWGLAAVGEDERVVIDVKRQGQAVGLESLRQEVEMCQEGFGRIEPGPSIIVGGIIQEVEQDMFAGGFGEESMWGGIILPERPRVANLPAFDWFGRGFVAGVWRELVFDGPAADTGAVGWEVEPAVEFAGGGAVGRGWLGRKKLGQPVHQRCSFIILLTNRPALSIWAVS